METIKVDLLVVGNVSTTGYASCVANSGLWSLSGKEINPDNPPAEIEAYGQKFDISDAIIVKASGVDNTVRIRSLLVAHGKVFAATGEIIVNVK